MYPAWKHVLDPDRLLFRGRGRGLRHRHHRPLSRGLVRRLHPLFRGHPAPPAFQTPPASPGSSF